MIIPSIEHDLNVGNTEIFVSHKWAPHEETQTEKRPSRKRTARVVSNIKSMGDGFVVEEDETERQQRGAVSGSSVSRKRPLESDSSGPLVSDSSGKSGHQ